MIDLKTIETLDADTAAAALDEAGLTVPLDEWTAEDRAWSLAVDIAPILPVAGMIAGLVLSPLLPGSFVIWMPAGLAAGLALTILWFWLLPRRPKSARQAVSDAFAVDAVLSDDARPFDRDGVHPLALRVDGDLRPASLLVHHAKGPRRAPRIALFGADGVALSPAASE